MTRFVITLCCLFKHLPISVWVLFALSGCLSGMEGGATRNVRDFGVLGEGLAAETGKIQGAIDACAVEGGCTLLFPSGRYVSGTLFLRDSVTLHLTPGAILVASGNANDYPAPALIYGKGVDTIAITGPGEVQAGPVPAPDETTIRNPGSRLVSLVLLENCTNVRIRDVRFRRSPVYTISLRVVENAWVENVSIENAMLAPGASGLVVDSSSRVNVRGLQFRGGGEGIILQSNAVEGVSPPTEHITISDTILESGAMAFRVGTRTHGDIRNVVVNNLVVTRSQGGIGVFVRDGGAVENLQFANTVIHTRPVHRDAAEWPLVLDLKRRGEESPRGVLRGIRFQGTQIHSGGKMLLSGFTGNPIRDVQFDGLGITASIQETSPARQDRPWRSPLDQVAGEDTMAAAIVGGYLMGASFRDVRVQWSQADPSPEGHALFLHSSDGVQLDGWQVRQAKTGGNLAALHVMGSRNLEIRNSTAPAQTGVWLQLQRMSKQDVFLSGNATGAAYRDVLVAK